MDAAVDEIHAVEVAECSEQIHAAVVNEWRGARGVAVVEPSLRWILDRPDPFSRGGVESVEDIVPVLRVAVTDKHHPVCHGHTPEPLIEEWPLPDHNRLGGQRVGQPGDLSVAMVSSPAGPG